MGKRVKCIDATEFSPQIKRHSGVNRFEFAMLEVQVRTARVDAESSYPARPG